jgi:hypothetical protein
VTFTGFLFVWILPFSALYYFKGASRIHAYRPRLETTGDESAENSFRIFVADENLTSSLTGFLCL